VQCKLKSRLQSYDEVTWEQGLSTMYKPIVLFGVFRTVDLRQPYDSGVTRWRQLFIPFVTFTLWCITFGVMHYSTLPCRHTLVYSTSWDSPVRMPAPSSISGSRCYYPRLRYRLIHWGPLKCDYPLASSSSTSWKTYHQLVHCSSR